MLENAIFKLTAIYKTLYSEMTEGNFSKMKAMHGGMMGRHVEYRDQLAEQIALRITKYCNDTKDLAQVNITQVKKGLEVKLSEFSSRKETADAFGWKELWLGGHIAGDEDKQKIFVKSVVTYNLSSNSTVSQGDQSGEVVMDAEGGQHISGGLHDGGIH